MESKVLEILNLVRSNKNRPAIKVSNLNDSLRNDYGLDSFDLAELTVRIEDEFGIDIFADGLVNTIGEVYEKLK
ncbi:MAG: acyl carrier protein [Bacteroidales bacterium]